VSTLLTEFDPMVPAAAVRPVSATGTRPAEQSIERKYVFPEPYGLMLVDWLSASLVADPAFSAGVVTSLYFDTPGLALYQQKRNSEYLKAKVRLRWYGSGTGTVPCFVEIKRKIGGVREKVRVPVDFPAEALGARAFDHPEVCCAPLHADPRLQGVPLVPMFLVQYRRRRFIDPITGVRVALDTAVRCLGANPAFLSRAEPVTIPCGVLETKGALRELPAIMSPIAPYLRKDAFSKYAACCEHVMQPNGRRV
jgi:hypothetical protein